MAIEHLEPDEAPEGVAHDEHRRRWVLVEHPRGLGVHVVDERRDVLPGADVAQVRRHDHVGGLAERAAEAEHRPIRVGPAMLREQHPGGRRRCAYLLFQARPSCLLVTPSTEAARTFCDAGVGGGQIIAASRSPASAAG